MIRAFRLCKTELLDSAFSGEESCQNGGRWNSPGHRVVYTSSSLSLATLEILVHLEDPTALSQLYSWIPLEIPPPCIEHIAPDSLPPEWANDDPTPAVRAIGDHWLQSHKNAALAVPSAVTPGEWNYLINPSHTRFSEIRAGDPRPFEPNPRLMS
jgi:RES domain-containing protein